MLKPFYLFGILLEPPKVCCFLHFLTIPPKKKTTYQTFSTFKLFYGKWRGNMCRKKLSHTDMENKCLVTGKVFTVPRLPPPGTTILSMIEMVKMYRAAGRFEEEGHVVFFTFHSIKIVLLISENTRGKYPKTLHQDLIPTMW